jgi:tetratricopeptide (TPR) repeat protein
MMASEFSPDVLTVSLRLADIYYARDQFEEAVVYYRRVLALDPDSPNMLYRLGLACFRAGREEEALAALDRAISVRGDFSGAYYLRAAIHRAIGKEDEVESDLLRALEFGPDSDEVRRALFEHYLDRRDADEAMKLVQEGIDREPQAPLHYLRLAAVHRLRGRHDDAIEAVGLALEQDPNLPRAYLSLGELWLEEGTRNGDRVAFEKAVAALESAAKMDPTNGSAALALGRACLAIGNEEKAYSELQRATEATPIQAEACGLLGDLYAGRDDYAEAATAYHAYLKLVGEVPSVLEKLGDAYLSMENVETAAQTYLQLTSLEPQRATPFIKAARALLANGESREAERICRRGLSSNPQNEALQSLLSQIAGAPEREPGVS